MPTDQPRERFIGTPVVARERHGGRNQLAPETRALLALRHDGGPRPRHGRRPP